MGRLKITSNVLDLTNAIFASLFGIGSRETPPWVVNAFQQSPAGQELLEFLTKPLPLSELEGLVPEMSQRLPALFEQGLESIQRVAPFAEELARTGFPTDVGAIAREQRRQLTQETVPNVAEMFGGAGAGPYGGLFGTDFGAALAREAAAVESEIGQLEVSAAEAAAGRRVQGIPLAAALSQAPTAFGISFLNDIGALGQEQRLREESVRPGARLFPAIPEFGALAPALPFVSGHIDSGSNTGALIGALLGAFTPGFGDPRRTPPIAGTSSERETNILSNIGIGFGGAFGGD